MGKEINGGIDKQSIQNVKELISLAKNKQNIIKYNICINFFKENKIDININDLNINGLVFDLFFYRRQNNDFNYMFTLVRIDNYLIENNL